MPKSFLPSNKDFFEIETFIYQEYLNTIEEFLDDEMAIHKSNLDELQKQLEREEIIGPDDPWQMPEELEPDYYQLDRLSQFANILRRSFIISIVSFLEITIVEHYRLKPNIGRQIKSPSSFKTCWEDIRGSLKTKYPKVTNDEWEEIIRIRDLRDAFAHAEGMIEIVSSSKKKKLEDYVREKEPKLRINSYWIDIDREFCEESFKRVVDFLEHILFPDEA